MPAQRKRAEAPTEQAAAEPEKQTPIEAPKEQEAQVVVPMTLQAFAEEVNRLIDRATADGLRPLPALATILAKRGMGLFDQTRASVADVVDRFLISLEGGNAKKEKK